MGERATVAMVGPGSTPSASLLAILQEYISRWISSYLPQLHGVQSAQHAVPGRVVLRGNDCSCRRYQPRPAPPHTQRLMSTSTYFMRIVIHHEANHSDDTCLCIPGSVLALFFDSRGFLVLPSCASTARGVHLPYRVECAVIAVKFNICMCTSRETTGTRRCGLCTTLASGEC